MEPEELMGDQTYSSTEEMSSASPPTIQFEHVDTPAAVQLERVVHNCSDHLLGTVTVANLMYHKEVYVRWTRDNWESSTDSSNVHNNRDTFVFQLPVAAAQIKCCIIYHTCMTHCCSRHVYMPGVHECAYIRFTVNVQRRHAHLTLALDSTLTIQSPKMASKLD